MSFVPPDEEDARMMNGMMGPGMMAVWTVVGILVIVLLVVLILKLLNK